MSEGVITRLPPDADPRAEEARAREGLLRLRPGIDPRTERERLEYEARNARALREARAESFWRRVGLPGPRRTSKILSFGPRKRE